MTDVTVVDASVLLGVLSREDAHHEAATALLVELAESPVLVHAMTLAEVLVGAARVGREAALLADLERLGLTLAARDDQEPLRLARLRATTGLKLPDCCVLDAAQQASSLLATFDHALAGAAGSLGLVVLPPPGEVR